MRELQMVAGSKGPVVEIGNRLRVLRVSFQVARHQLPCRHVLQINRSAKRRVVVALGGVAGQFGCMRQVAARAVKALQVVFPDLGRTQYRWVQARELEVRSEARRVGKGWVGTCRSRGSPYP